MGLLWNSGFNWVIGLDQLVAIDLGDGVRPAIDAQQLEYVSKIPLEGRVADGEVEIVVIIARYQTKEWFAEMTGLLLGKGSGPPRQIRGGPQWALGSAFRAEGPGKVNLRPE